MRVQRLIATMVTAACLLLFGRAAPASADVVDDLEDIGDDCTPVTARVIGGVTVTVSTQSGFAMTARTYYDGTCLAFSGHAGGDNAPLDWGSVSGWRFISSCDPSGGCFSSTEMVIFELDAPVTQFQLTTIDLLEDCGDGSYPSLTVRAFDSSGTLVDEHVREGVQGTSGLDLDWFVAADEIVRVEITGADVEGCGGYGIDDLVLDAPDCDNDGIFDVKDVCPCVPAPAGVDASGRPLGDLDGDCDVDLDDFTIMQQNFTGPH